MAAVALFAFFGVWLCLEGIGNIRRAAASAHWPKTEGSVTRSVAVASTSHNRADRTSSISYSADLEFRYLVNGASHATSLRHFGQLEGSTDSSEAELLRRRYPEGARVPIYYDPANPASAVTEPGFHADMLWLPSAGIFLLLPSLMFAAFLFGDSSPGAFDFGIVVFGGIFASLGLIGVLYGSIQIARAHEAVNWPRAQGQIVYDQIDSSTSVTKEEGTATRSTAYGTHLVFRYVVAGQTYFSNLRRFGQLAGAGEDWAADIAARYPKGSTFPVAYSPVNPQLAVLEPGFDTESLWLPGAGLASLLFGLAVVIFARRALAG